MSSQNTDDVHIPTCLQPPGQILPRINHDHRMVDTSGDYSDPAESWRTRCLTDSPESFCGTLTVSPSGLNSAVYRPTVSKWAHLEARAGLRATRSVGPMQGACGLLRVVILVGQGQPRSLSVETV